jgi:hypothetical protein
MGSVNLVALVHALSSTAGHTGFLFSRICCRWLGLMLVCQGQGLDFG